MNKKIFHLYKEKAALLGILSVSLFSFSFLDTPVYASSTSSVSTDLASTAANTTPVDSLPTTTDTASAQTDSASTTSEPASSQTDPVSATSDLLSAADTNTTTEAENSDFIIIDDMKFLLSAASPETLAAYEAYQNATAYQKQWNMLLVNKDHPLPDNYTFTQKTLPGYSMTVDERIYDPLLAMLNAGKNEGCRFMICSAYRSNTRQSQIYDSHIRDYRARGYSYEQAKEFTELSIAVPGSSEHQTGMAVDIVATYYQQLNSNFANTKEAKWLKEHAHEYGFILRYPKDKTDITRITFEPWHFRYVGIEAANEVFSLDVCYEEYLALKEQAVQDALQKLRTQVELDQTYSRTYNPLGNWLSDDYGTYFMYDDQTYPYDTWIQSDQHWYYFLSDGYLATGWLNLGNSWYYLNESNQSGEMVTGWYQEPATEKWYYLDKETGEMKTGWFMDETNGNRYYLSDDGSLLTAAFTPDGHYVDENGVYIPDIQQTSSIE